MALDANKIKANAVLTSLTEEQVTALVVLSTNDESTQLGSKIGELHGRYDADILAVTGLPKNQGEKSYDYVKRILGDYKTKLSGFDTVATEIATLKTEKTDLLQKLHNNAGDATLKQQLADATSRLGQLQTAYDADKAKFENDKTELVTKMHESKVESQLDVALSTLKFKATIPDSVKLILLRNAKSELFNTTKPEFAEIGGVQTLIFRDKAGLVLNNPENKLNPFTASELLAKSLIDVIDNGRKQSGGGTGPDKTQISNIVDISSAKSQVAADEIIQKHLLETGLLKTDPAFSAEQQKIRKEYAVEKLPIR
jgi:hypothetical protein